MKAKLLLVATISGLLLASCGRSERTRRPPPPEVSLSVPPVAPMETKPEKVVEQLRASVHAKLDCADCHAPKEGAAARDVGKGQCTGCHKDENKAYSESIHAHARAEGKKEAANCEDCHGTHDTRRVSDPESRVSQLNIPKTCSKCHENPETAKKLGIKAPEAIKQYVESIHGRGLLAYGLTVAPSCADCHGRAHHIFEAKDPRSSVNRYKVADTCGHCHSGPRAEWGKGIHAEKLHEEQTTGKVAKDKEEQPPTCPTCHSAHSIIEPGPRFVLAEDHICGKCHENRLERYLETYHGRAHDLGDPDVAACHNCHGPHDIWPSKDARSTLATANRLGTCRQCHVKAPPNFAGYLAHADFTDKKNYPTLYWAYISMTGLLVGVFGFFGLHTLMWFTRSLIVKYRDPEHWKAAKEKAREEKGQRLYSRFRPIDRFVHFLVIVSFMALVITGMPLKFHTRAWAHTFFNAVGGAGVAASVHRFAAIVTLTYFVLHIGSLFVLLRRNGHKVKGEDGRMSIRAVLKLAFGPDSPFPRWQDAKDIVAHLRYFVGGGPKPRFDRFTYWEKFDYMAVFWGVTVIGLSGLVMWFPEMFTRVLPGWSINIAHIIHSDEALLAAGFIFTFHFFNSHFRPEKFPYDPVMFSGHVTEEELKHERPAQYERMEAAEELEKTIPQGEWPQWKLIINVFGAAAIVLGLSLAAAIFYALLK